MKFQKVHQNILFKCLACKKNFDSTRGLSLHTSALSYCLEISQLVQKSITLLPGNIQSNVAINQPSTPADLNNELDDDLLSDKSNDEPHITYDNDNIDESTNQNFYFSQDIFHEVKLMKLLNEIGAPLYSYKKSMEWAREAYLSDYKFDSPHTSYNATLNHLEKNCNLKYAIQ